MDTPTTVLDEKGFVFIGADGKPYWCKMSEGDPWFYWWHPDNLWVTYKRVNQLEVWLAHEQAIPAEQASLYHKLALFEP